MNRGGGVQLGASRPDPATVAALCGIIEDSGSRALAVVGLAKNAGKTTVVNALLANCSGPYGLTSLGLDGERIDHLTGLAKPRIAPPTGTLVATTQGSLDRSHYVLEVLEELPHHTPLGHVLIGRAAGRGQVEISGPTTLADLCDTIVRLQAHGAGRVLVDGAINRLGSASPRVCDGLVMATGGMVADTLDDVVEITASTLDMLLLPETSGEIRKLVAPCAAQNTRVAAFGDDGAATLLEMGSAVGEGVRVAREVERLQARTLFIGGAVTAEFADDLVRVLPARHELRIVVRDATVLVLPAPMASRLMRRGISVEVLAALRVLAVTVNPFRIPRPYQPKLFFDAIAGVVGDRVPVFDVVNGRAFLPKGTLPTVDVSS